MESAELGAAEGGRPRTMTQRGLEYQRELKMNERNRHLRSVENQTTYLNQLIANSDSNVSNVKFEHSDWLNNYEKLLVSQDELQRLLDTDEAKEDKVRFAQRCETFNSTNKAAEEWFLQNAGVQTTDQTRDDDRSHSSVRSRYSGNSKGSSRVSSHLSIAKLKESQQKVELVARAAALDEKLRLEEEKLKLKMKEEEYELRTAMKISDAKTKVIEELERSMIHDQVIEETLNIDSDKEYDIKRHSNVNDNVKVQVVKDDRMPLKESSTTSKEHKPVSGSREGRSDENSVTNQNISSVARELNKPKSEIQKFEGNPMHYKRFIRQFDARVNSNTDSYEERLNFLLQFTTGEANRIVTGYSNLEAEKGYKASLDEFRERYGDADVIARAYVKKALEWPPIKQDQPKALDDYAIFLRECLFAVENVDAIKVLEYSENLKVIVQKLPYYLHDKWRKIVYDIKAKGSSVNFEHLVKLVRKEAKKATDPIYGKDVISAPSTVKKQSFDTRPNKYGKIRKNFAATVPENDGHYKQDIAFSKSCLYCAGQHYLDTCDSITQLSLKDRYSFLKSKGLCFACLKSGHMKGGCRNKLLCKRCKRDHPTILHVNPTTQFVSNFPQSQSGTNSDTRVKTTSYAAHTGAGAQSLPIVPVRLKCKKSDKYIETYAFLDTGSTATFCSERAAAMLHIEGRKTSINLHTMGQERIQNAYEISGLEISSLDGANVLDLPPIFSQKTRPVSSQDVPSQKDIENWTYLGDLQIDRIDSEVDLLIGINVPKAIEPWDVIPSENGGPFAVKTMFGWVINGPLEETSEKRNSSVTCNYIKTVPSLDEQLRNQFNHDFSERTIDDLPEPSREDKLFLSTVSQPITKNKGHYSIDLPFKYKSVSMPNNRKQCEQRLKMLAKRFGRNNNFRDEYCNFMEKVIEKGYARRVLPDDKPEIGRVWYLPHHGVIHPRKNKLRVVFDCAATYQGTSLNNQLLQGPNLTNSLVGTLIRFREEEVAVMGDIESMFYQVRVSQKDRNFQRFLLWEDGDPGKEPIEYLMNVHLFGSTSSPSCANFALRKTAQEAHGQFNEEVIITVLRNFYVDDCLKSVKTVKIAESLVEDLQAVLGQGGFHIAKWVSNSREVMSSIPVSERASEVQNLDLDQDSLPIERTLGVNWCIESDTFRFSVNVTEKSITRRGILSKVSSIYDPLGFLAPLILNAKILLQELCQLQLGWDDPIPDRYKEQWLHWLKEITNLRDFKVDRCFNPHGFETVAAAELHHFADASERGYGTVTYLRLINTEGQIHCSFVLGKSRVTPLKKVTVPRLELTAATVAVRTHKMLKDELDMKIDKTVFWTDSMSVLRYIHNTNSRFHTFVANRLTVIHEGSEPENWRYINTKFNPADIASRGLPVNETMWSNQWIEAPQFLLTSEDNWPEFPAKILDSVEDDPEVKRVTVRAIVTNNSKDGGVNSLIHAHSSWYKLKRSVAWLLKIRNELCRRVSLKNVPEKVTEDTNLRKISVEDMHVAESAILVFVQQSSFVDEINTLCKGNSCVKQNSSIRKLDPQLTDGLLRVGGRLQKSRLPAEGKHPVILPKNHHVSELILRQTHNDLRHSGRNYMLAS